VEASSTTVSEEPVAAQDLPSEQKAEMEKIADPPSPSSVPVIAPFTKEDLFSMDTSAERQVDEDLSLIVHIDESQMDLDNDLLNTPAKSLVTDDKSVEDNGSTTPKAENQGSGAGGSVEVTPTKATDSSEKVEPGSDPDAATPAKDQKTSQSKDGDKAKRLVCIHDPFASHIHLLKAADCSMEQWYTFHYDALDLRKQI
jgi:hypothetical protein